MLEGPPSPGHIDRPLAAIAETRRDAAEEARSRRLHRLFVAGVFAAAVVALLVIAIGSYAMPRSCARAVHADVAHRPEPGISKARPSGPGS